MTPVPRRRMTVHSASLHLPSAQESEDLRGVYSHDRAHGADQDEGPPGQLGLKWDAGPRVAEGEGDQEEQPGQRYAE